MIRYLEGDIFLTPAQTIVNTVNTVGVMGKGIALEFKKRYPDMFEKYKVACEKKKRNGTGHIRTRRARAPAGSAPAAVAGADGACAAAGCP